MQGIIFAACATLFTCLTTALGAALVFVLWKNRENEIERTCLGFSAGVMAAAAVFSLLMPAIEKTREMGGIPFAVASLGFALGAGAMIAVERWMERHWKGECEGERRRALMIAAVTLHNIPEGMAVGLAFAVAAKEDASALAAAVTLAIGIGLQNIPEGAAISLPLRHGGMSRAKSFLWGAASGLTEPIAGILVVLAASAMQAALPGLMAFAAGAMMLVVVSEMIPEAVRDKNGVILVMTGFVIMMALDVALG